MENKIIELKNIDGYKNDCHVKLINFPVYIGVDGDCLLNANYISDSLMDKLWCAKGKNSIFTKGKGFINKKNLCPACFNVLDVSRLTTNKITTTLYPEKNRIVDLEVSMLMIICDKCQKKSIIGTQKYAFQMEYAIMDAFDKNKIR